MAVGAASLPMSEPVVGVGALAEEPEPDGTPEVRFSSVGLHLERCLETWPSRVSISLHKSCCASPTRKTWEVVDALSLPYGRQTTARPAYLPQEEDFSWSDPVQALVEARVPRERRVQEARNRPQQLTPPRSAQPRPPTAGGRDEQDLGELIKLAYPNGVLSSSNSAPPSAATGPPTSYTTPFSRMESALYRLKPSTTSTRRSHDTYTYIHMIIWLQVTMEQETRL